MRKDTEKGRLIRIIQPVVITGLTESLGQALCCLLFSKGIEVYAVCYQDSSQVRMLKMSSEYHHLRYERCGRAF